MTYVGASVKRLDDPRLLTGRGRFVDDITLPRLLHVAIVRSPHAHARIRAIDASAARRAPGVARLLTGEETAKLCAPCRGILQHYRGMKTGAMLALAQDRVRYVGEPVVAIAARSRAEADDAAGLVTIDYEPLPPVLSAEEAIGSDAPLIHPELGDNVIYRTTLAGGEVDAAFAAADRRYAHTFQLGRHTGVPLEPRGLVADFEPSTRAFTVWISTQVPHMMQAVLADLFGFAKDYLRVDYIFWCTEEPFYSQKLLPFLNSGR